MTMNDLFVWLEWLGADSLFYRKRFLIKGHRRWLKHLGKVVTQTRVFMIYRVVPHKTGGRQSLNILFFNHSPLNLRAIMEGAHQFAEGIKADLTRVYVGDEYGDLKVECPRD